MWPVRSCACEFSRQHKWLLLMKCWQRWQDLHSFLSENCRHRRPYHFCFGFSGMHFCTVLEDIHHWPSNMWSRRKWNWQWFSYSHHSFVSITQTVHLVKLGRRLSEYWALMRTHYGWTLDRQIQLESMFWNKSAIVSACDCIHGLLLGGPN